MGDDCGATSPVIPHPPYHPHQPLHEYSSLESVCHVLALAVSSPEKKKSKNPKKNLYCTVYIKMYKKYFLFEKEYCILNIFRLLKLIKVTALPNF
jgi:hypothetical protein